MGFFLNLLFDYQNDYQIEQKARSNGRSLSRLKLFSAVDADDEFAQDADFR